MHNINFPPHLTDDAPLTQTELALSEIPSLFMPTETQSGQKNADGSPRKYTFSFSSPWAHTYNPESSDFRALKRGEVSHTVIQWDTLSGRIT